MNCSDNQQVYRFLMLVCLACLTVLFHMDYPLIFKMHALFTCTGFPSGIELKINVGKSTSKTCRQTNCMHSNDG